MASDLRSIRLHDGVEMEVLYMAAASRFYLQRQTCQDVTLGETVLALGRAYDSLILVAISVDPQVICVLDLLDFIRWTHSPENGCTVVAQDAYDGSELSITFFNEEEKDDFMRHMISLTWRVLAR
ncbi:hypothetical protein ONZ51_g4243 [Trametes cubensis]|uniref:Uncharacterized protein n=1 Tax=Trametes cubensis TaxID=1111947 RepID=A0AAD7TWH3_9APHY|nr:hypothetical protein ONZ51_g4243 [Trametes cubensis]